MALTLNLDQSSMVADNYGEGLKFNITLAQMVALGAFTTGSLVLPFPGGGFPPGAIVQLLRIKHSQALVGAGPVSAATIQMATANNTYGSAFDIFQAVSNTALYTLQATSSNVENFAAVTPVQVNFALTGGNLSGLTAGAVSLWIRYVLLA